MSLPDLLIFEDDLKLRNYIVGLGYLGLKKMDEAELEFNDLIKYDAIHFGAQTHLGYLNELKRARKAIP